MARSAFALVVATTLVLAASVGGCEEPEGELGMAVQLYTPSGGPDPFLNVTWLRIRVEGAGLGSESHASFVRYTPEGFANLNDIPYGNDRQVVIEGYTAAPDGNPQIVVSRGRSVPDDILSGASVTTVTVLFARVNAFSTLTDAASREPQSLLQGRVGHTVTPTARKEIVIAGGGSLTGKTDGSWWKFDDYVELTNSVEVVNELNHKVTPHPAGMTLERVWHTATPLNTGQILFAGGYAGLDGERQAAPLVDVYHPGAGSKIERLHHQLAVARAGHTATVIDEGSYTVLFVGGDEEGTFEVWDPHGGTMGAQALPDGLPRRFHQATLFNVPGRPQPAVFISGGESASGPLKTVLVYDLASNLMVQLAAEFAIGRVHHTATHVPARGYIYVTGGYLDNARSQVTSQIDVYEIASDSIISSALNLNTARGGHAATALGGNSVLISGGADGLGSPLNSVEVIHEYLDADQQSYVIDVVASQEYPDGTVVLPFLNDARVGQQAVLMANGMALLVGGATGGTVDTPYVMPPDLTIYNPQ